MTAIFAATALVVAGTAPAGAQEIPDVPELGFLINPLEGPVGSFVVGNVNVADVDEHCVTSGDEFLDNMQATSAAMLDDPVAGHFVPGGWPPDDFFEPVIFDMEAVSWALTSLVPEQITLEQAEDALPATFVMAFADLATASPIEPMGSFDPNSGVGQTVVPEIAAGVHPVIATCVQPTTDSEALIEAVLANVPVVEAILPVIEERIVASGEVMPPLPWSLFDFFGVGGFFGLTVEEGLVDPAELAVALMEPRALGFDFYCVLDDSGVCPVEDFDPTPPEDFEIPAEPVTTTPRFTG